MLRRTLLATLVAAIALPAFAQAAPSDKGQCRQEFNDAFVALSEEGTRGDFMSDFIFGNEPNEGPNGETVPTQSPGPFVNNPNDPDNPRFGFTGGDLQALVKARCG